MNPFPRLFIILCIAFAFAAADSAVAFTEYDARIGEKEILTPAPGPAPRINGPKVSGARPEKRFLYRIPCQGERPIRFSVVPRGWAFSGSTDERQK